MVAQCVEILDDEVHPGEIEDVGKARVFELKSYVSRASSGANKLKFGGDLLTIQIINLKRRAAN